VQLLDGTESDLGVLAEVLRQPRGAGPVRADPDKVLLAVSVRAHADL
jgi:hypothetical protein